MRTHPFIRLMLFTFLLLLVSGVSMAQVRISVSFGPPALPVYEQPVCPGDGYIWTPGYWAYDQDQVDDYYWVPGTWVEAPEVGMLWTPPYWGWGGNGFVFYDGYWGPEIGFYGGINYGFGYFGHGYEGGRWDHNHFYYNRAVTNVNETIIRNVYNVRVNESNNSNRVSYNGGNGGINVRPTGAEEAAVHARHIPPVAAQAQHAQASRSNPELRATVNHGRPPIAATPRPGAFREGAVPAKAAGAPYQPPANHAGRAPASPAANVKEPAANTPRPPAAVHPKELPPIERPVVSSSGNPKQDQKYQQQQDKLIAKQNQDRQKLQQQHDKEHQQLAKQNAPPERTQQVEQKHQQQTQQLAQKHAQQQQNLQSRQPQPSRPQSEPRGESRPR